MFCCRLVKMDSTRALSHWRLLWQSALNLVRMPWNKLLTRLQLNYVSLQNSWWSLTNLPGHWKQVCVHLLACIKFYYYFNITITNYNLKKVKLWVFRNLKRFSTTHIKMTWNVLDLFDWACRVATHWFVGFF